MVSDDRPLGGLSPPATSPPHLLREGRTRIAAAYYGTFALLGLMLTSVGPSLDALRAQSASSTEAVALLFTATSLGYIGGSLLAGRLYGRIAGHRVMPVALVAMALVTLAVPTLGSLPMLLAAFVLIGVPLGVLDVGGNTLLVWLYRADVPPYMNALHLSFGVGAFVGPLVFDRFAVATGNAATTYWLFAALMVPIAFWLARLPSPASPAGAHVAAGGPGVVRRHAPLIALIALFFFLHMGAELAFGGWIFTYGDQATGSETVGRLLNSAFWGGLVIGRLVAIPLAVRLSARAMLLLDLLGSVASLVLIIALPDSTTALWIGTIGYGFFVASLIPGSFNLAERHVPITGNVSATLVIGGSLGAMTLPWVVGQLYEPRGPMSVMVVTASAMVGACIVFALILVRARGARRSASTDAPGLP